MLTCKYDYLNLSSFINAFACFSEDKKRESRRTKKILLHYRKHIDMQRPMRKRRRRYCFLFYSFVDNDDVNSSFDVIASLSVSYLKESVHKREKKEKQAAL